MYLYESLLVLLFTYIFFLNRYDPNNENSSGGTSTGSIVSRESTGGRISTMMSSAGEDSVTDIKIRSIKSVAATAKRCWVIRPRNVPVVLETKSTLAAAMWGRAVNSMFWVISRSPISFLLTFPGVICMFPMLEEDILGSVNWSFGVLLVHSSLFPGMMILNTVLMRKIMTSFYTWYMLAMSFFLSVCWFSSMLDVRAFAVVGVLPGMFFSIVLDAYPGSGRFIAGVRFYGFKLSLVVTLLSIIVFTDRGKDFFVFNIGNVEFNGASLCFTFGINLFVFGMRNLFQLIREPECLVVVSSLMEYAYIPEIEADKEIASYANFKRQKRKGRKKKNRSGADSSASSTSLSNADSSTAIGGEQEGQGGGIISKADSTGSISKMNSGGGGESSSGSSKSH